MLPPSLPLLSCRCVPLPPDDEEVDDGVIDSLLVGPLLLPTPEGLAATEICRLLVLSWPPPYDGDGEMRGPDRGEPDRDEEPLPSDLPDEDDEEDEWSANAAEATGGGGCLHIADRESRQYVRQASSGSGSGSAGGGQGTHRRGREHQWKRRNVHR